MKKIVFGFIIIAILLINTISFGALSWDENFPDGKFPYEDDDEHFGPPQIGSFADLLLCCKSGSRLNAGHQYEKVASGNLDAENQTSYIVSETRRTGRHMIHDEQGLHDSNDSKNNYKNMASVYNAYEQQYAFWQNHSDAKASIGGTDATSANSSLAEYTRRIRPYN